MGMPTGIRPGGRRFGRRAALVAAVAALLLAGCGPGGGREGPDEADGTRSAGPTSAPPSGGSSLPTASPGPSSSREPLEGTLLSVTRTGGIAGAYASVVVASDGTLETRDEPGLDADTGRMPGGRLGELRALLAGEAFRSLPRRTFDQPSPDAYVYEFVTPGHAVLADDTSLREPLRDVLALVGPWLNGGG